VLLETEVALKSARHPCPLRWFIAFGAAGLIGCGGTARASVPWSMDIQQLNDSGGGGQIGCVELSCQGEVSLLFWGQRRTVRVQAFLDIKRSMVKLAFEDDGASPYWSEFTQLRPLRIGIDRNGTGNARITLRELPQPNPNAGSGIDDLVHRIVPHAFLSINVAVVGGNR
jgi:hypothetical protein